MYNFLFILKKLEIRLASQLLQVSTSLVSVQTYTQRVTWQELDLAHDKLSHLYCKYITNKFLFYYRIENNLDWYIRENRPKISLKKYFSNISVKIYGHGAARLKNIFWSGKNFENYFGSWNCNTNNWTEKYITDKKIYHPNISSKKISSNFQKIWIKSSSSIYMGENMAVEQKG